jgi:hypothetical protein
MGGSNKGMAAWPCAAGATHDGTGIVPWVALSSRKERDTVHGDGDER